MSKHKYIKFIYVLPVMMLLSGCVGEEPNDIAYVTAVGIDKADSGYLYTIQFANPKKISGGASEEGGSGGKTVEHITVQSPTLYSSINNANAIVSKDFSLSHAKIIVVSEEVAKEGLKNLGDTIARNNEIRPDVYIAVAENAGEYLEEIRPVIEVNPVKYYQLTYENNNGSRVPQNSALDFYFGYKSGSEDCALPLAGVAQSDEESKVTNDKGGKDDESQDKSITNKSQDEAEMNVGGFENNTKNHLAGQAGVKITNRSEVMGLAVFCGDKYVGKMGSTEAEIYNILIGRFTEESITFYSEKTPDVPITLKLEEKVIPQYKVDKNTKTVDILIKLNGEIQSVSEESKEIIITDEYERQSAQMVSDAANSLIYKLYKELNSDALGIKGKLKKEFLTLEEYDKYCETFKPSEWSFNVRTKLQIQRTGMTYVQ